MITNKIEKKYNYEHSKSNKNHEIPHVAVAFLAYIQ